MCAKEIAKTENIAEIYQLKITLRDSKPPIWRRIQVPGDITLAELHLVFQRVMGWENDHLHAFAIGGIQYSEPEPAPYENDGEIQDENSVTLNQVVSGKAKFSYEYDFGDSWEHQIILEKVLPPETGVQYPVCLTGKRACPPEDCGGIWGYAELLEAISDPNHPEHDERLEWLGDEFDPGAFDLEAINQDLRDIH